MEAFFNIRSYFMLKRNDIMLMAEGKWECIIPALSGRQININHRKHSPCPVHGGKDGFRVFKDFARTGGTVCSTCGCFKDGIATLMWLNNWTLPQTCKEIYNFLHGNRFDVGEVHSTPEKEEPKKKVNPIYLWNTGSYIADTAAENYLNNRAIKSGDFSFGLRFKSSVMVMTAAGKLQLPCMVAAIRDREYRVVATHKTFLDSYGNKADIPNPKRLSPLNEGETITGCAVYLKKPKKKLIVSEGIETALSAWQIAGSDPEVGCAALISASFFRGFLPPEGVEEVLIYADRDRSGTGLEAAKALAENLVKHNIHGKILLPKQELKDNQKGIDWNDILRQHG